MRGLIRVYGVRARGRGSHRDRIETDESTSSFSATLRTIIGESYRHCMREFVLRFSFIMPVAAYKRLLLLPWQPGRLGGADARRSWQVR